MALPTNRELGDLRSELLGRLGYSQQGSQAGPKVSLVNSHLRTAQVFLYYQFDLKELIEVSDEITTGVGLRFYDWPDHVDPMQVLQVVSVDSGAGSTGNITPLEEGIDWQDDSYNTPNSEPRKFERRSQIEVWPAPDSVNYTIRLEYVKRLGRFTQDGDLCTVNSDLILMYALMTTKAHYKAPDAGLYQSEVEKILFKMKSKNSSSKRLQRLPRVQSGGFSDDFDSMKHMHIEDV